MSKIYVADTEFGPVKVKGKDLKTLILYLFDGELSPFKYQTVSKKPLTSSNNAYFRKLYRIPKDRTRFAYGANEVRLYTLKESVDN
jgi:hypothetical protein